MVNPGYFSLAATARKLQQLEQLERLRSEDTPCRLMITHTIESYWIPSQKKTKSKLQIKKFAKISIWNGSDEYCWRYRADTILSTDGQTDKVIPVYPPFNFVEAGDITIHVSTYFR